jgi:hypothetical protein
MAYLRDTILLFRYSSNEFGEAMIGTIMVLSVLFTGCDKSGAIELDTAITTLDDTGEITTVETGTEDTGVTVHDPVASFILNEVTEGATFSLTWVNPMGDSLVYGETAFSTDAQKGTMEIYLPHPSEDEMISVDEASGWGLAFYVPALHEDSNGDGNITLLETIFGVGEYWLFFSNISLPDQGIDYGWNALRFGVDQFIAPFDLPLAENLHPVNTISISGDITGDQQNISDYRLAAIPITMFMGLPVAELLYDESLEPNWTLSLNGAPPIDHLQDNQDLNSSYAIEYLAVYEDDNSNYSYDLSDEILTGVCRDGRSVSMVYMGAPRDLAGNVLFVFQGLTPGWYVMESWVEPDGTESNELISSPEWLGFNIGQPCWPDDG